MRFAHRRGARKPVRRERRCDGTIHSILCAHRRRTSEHNQLLIPPDVRKHSRLFKRLYHAARFTLHGSEAEEPDELLAYQVGRKGQVEATQTLKVIIWCQGGAVRSGRDFMTVGWRQNSVSFPGRKNGEFAFAARSLHVHQLQGRARPGRCCGNRCDNLGWMRRSPELVNDSGTESCRRVQKPKRDETRRRGVGGIGRDNVTRGNSGGGGACWVPPSII